MIQPQSPTPEGPLLVPDPALLLQRHSPSLQQPKEETQGFGASQSCSEPGCCPGHNQLAFAAIQRALPVSYIRIFNSMALSSTQSNGVRRRKNEGEGMGQRRNNSGLLWLFPAGGLGSKGLEDSEPPSGADKAVDKSRRSQHQRAAGPGGPPCRVQLEGVINTAVGRGDVDWDGIWPLGSQ